MPKKTLIFGGIILIIALVMGSWFWCEFVWEKQDQGDQEQQSVVMQKDALNTQEENKIPEDGKLHPRNPRIIPIDGKTTDWYEIPELGVKVELNNKFALNLIYAVHAYRTPSSGIYGVTAYFLSKDAILEGCDLNELSYGDSGALSILYTKNINELHDEDFFPSADPRRSEFKGKQFEDFYIYSDSSKDTCRSIMLEEVQKGRYIPKNLYHGSGATFIDSANVVPIDTE